jgi:hypothetical protein
MATGKIRNRGARLVFLQDRNNLFFGIALAIHIGTFLG